MLMVHLQHFRNVAKIMDLISLKQSEGKPIWKDAWYAVTNFPIMSII